MTNRIALGCVALLVAFALVHCGCTPVPEKNEQPSEENNPVGKIDYAMATPVELPTLKSERDFNEFIQKNRVAVVKFGADWCPPCRKLDPELERIAGYFQAPDISFALIDVDRLGQLARAFNIASIPETFVFIDGKPYAHVSGYDPQSIASVVESVVQREIPTEEAAEKVKRKSLEEELWGDEPTADPEPAEASEAPDATDAADATISDDAVRDDEPADTTADTTVEE